MAIYDAIETVRKSPVEILQHALDPFWLGEKIAFLGAIEGHFASNVSFERLRSINPLAENVYQSFSIIDPIDGVIARLNDFAPSYLITYPTAAVTLAEKTSSGALTMRPREIWTGGETLTKTMRNYIEGAFGSRVRNAYGASEFLPIARECDFGNLHVNSDWVILEAVDDQYRPVPDGHMSHTTLLTNLANYVQPLIRYDIGDSIRFHTSMCPCGSHFPAIDVMGRKDGLMKVLDDQGKTLNLLPLAITTVIEEDAGIFDFQIAQQDKTTLVLRLPHRKQHPAQDMHRCKAALQSYLNKQGASKIKLITESNAQIVLSRSGKLNRILMTSK
jgi:phenylacetate-coenzyme A ligase PaaK-like adenylate-forming protein